MGFKEKDQQCLLEDPSEEHNLGSVQSPAGDGDDGKGDIFPVFIDCQEVWNISL